MFFANSRSRFKSNSPPRLLLNCLKLTSLLVLLVLLIAQLRAIELPAPGPPKFSNGRRNQPAPPPEILIGQQRQDSHNDTSTNGRAISIDRDDRDGISEVGEPLTVVEQANSTESTDLEQDRSGGRHNDHVATNSIRRPSEDAPGSSTVFDSPDGDLAVAPATAQVQTASSGQELPSYEGAANTVSAHDGLASTLYGGQQMAPLAPAMPSLAEMTAAGTAAGLLIHDLVAQANNQDDQSAFQANQQGGDGGESNPSDFEADQQTTNDAELSAQMQQMIANDQPMQSAQQFQETANVQPSNDEDMNNGGSGGGGEDDDEGPQNVGNSYPMNGQQQMLTRAEAVNRLNAANGNQRENSETAEPASEDASPDSIESLMGAEGADLNTNDEANGGQAERADAVYGQPQQLADSNLISSNELAGSGGGGPLSPLNVASNEDDDEDEDGGAEVGQPAAVIDAQGSQLRANHIERGQGGAPVLMSTRYLGPPKFGSEIEHNLVAPMRESLVDLNAAAGHYSYGKKKKKKKVEVKKKIIIKKGKKKKKKKKYKKIKIVKIKKKKKKVKKKKGKKHHHIHHHHEHKPDHGKYYMYAKVPKKKAWEFGFKKGNKKHWIERHEKGYKNKFKTKVKWYDKKSKGKGVHIWDYNHHDKKKKKHH